MAKQRVLVTGATGMVGSHVARHLVAQGYEVRGLTRSTSDRSELQDTEIEWIEGDLSEPSSLPLALAGIDLVVHAAAHVGDWGPAEKYRSINVTALEHLLTAAHREGRLQRWIQISSLGVYPARHHHGTTEEVEIDLAGLDGYTKTKAEAEVLLKRHMEEHGFPAVILRPGFIYGRGDRHVVPRLIERIAAGQMKLIGDGERVLNNTYVENLSDAVLLALTVDRAIGETFNIRDERLVTRNEFVSTIAAFMNCPPPKHVPERLARAAVIPIEWLARLRKCTEAPLLTRARIKFLTQNLDFSIAKAQTLLGYRPSVDFREGMEKTLHWARDAGLIPRERAAERPQLAVGIRP